MVVLDLLRSYLHTRFDLGVPGPYEGASAIAFHVDEAGFAHGPRGLPRPS